MATVSRWELVWPNIQRNNNDWLVYRCTNINVRIRPPCHTSFWVAQEDTKQPSDINNTNDGNYPPHSGITRYTNSPVTTHCYGRNRNSILLSEFYTLRTKLSRSHHQTKYNSTLQQHEIKITYNIPLINNNILRVYRMFEWPSRVGVLCFLGTLYTTNQPWRIHNTSTSQHGGTM